LIALLDREMRQNSQRRDRAEGASKVFRQQILFSQVFFGIDWHELYRSQRCLEKVEL